ncbi:MAG TPA: AAA family ATPase [Solirubrobacteraceae bacterium]|jgi:hypothetical protein
MSRVAVLAARRPSRAATPSVGPWRINAVDPESGAAVWIVTGIMAAGRSTVAQALAERLPRSAHVSGDVFRRMVVTGAAPMTRRPSREALRQLRLRHHLSAAVADGYAAAGFEAVLQDAVVGAELPALVAAVRTRPAYCVVLAPSVATVRARGEGRARTGYGAFTSQDLDRVLRRETPRLGLWLDTSEQTPVETVEAVLARREEARVG